MIVILDDYSLEVMKYWNLSSENLLEGVIERDLIKQAQTDCYDDSIIAEREEQHNRRCAIAIAHSFSKTGNVGLPAINSKNSQGFGG